MSDYRAKAAQAVDAIIEKQGVVAMAMVRDMMITAYMQGNVEGQMEQHLLVRQMHAERRANNPSRR